MRCKFKLDRIERSLAGFWIDNKGVTKEIQTLVMTPVYDNSSESENGKFFAATPSGEFKVGTVNAEAVAEMKLGAEYYIDITPAS
jgi:hypothetical protein